MDLTKFAKIAKNRISDDFLCYLRFFAVLCHINNHLTRPSCGFNKLFAKIAKTRKFDDISRYLRFLAVLCHVNQFTFCPKSFCFTWHFGISLSAKLKHIHMQRPAQTIFKYRFVILRFEWYSWDSIVFQVSSFYAFFKLGVLEQGINIINVFFNWSKLFIHITSWIQHHSLQCNNYFH